MKCLGSFVVVCVINSQSRLYESQNRVCLWHNNNLSMLLYLLYTSNFMCTLFSSNALCNLIAQELIEKKGLELAAAVIILAKYKSRIKELNPQEHSLELKFCCLCQSSPKWSSICNISKSLFHPSPNWTAIFGISKVTGDLIKGSPWVGLETWCAQIVLSSLFNTWHTGFCFLQTEHIAGHRVTLFNNMWSTTFVWSSFGDGELEFVVLTNAQSQIDITRGVNNWMIGFLGEESRLLVLTVAWSYLVSQKE